MWKTYFEWELYASFLVSYVNDILSGSLTAFLYVDDIFWMVWLVLINIGEYLDEVEFVLNIDIHCDKSMRLIALSRNVLLVEVLNKSRME